MTTTIAKYEKPTPENVADAEEWVKSLTLTKFQFYSSVVRFRRLLQRIAEASTYDPGEADLDDEQPARSVGVDLGDVRLARRLLR